MTTYPCPWIDPVTDPLLTRIAKEAIIRVGVLETPPGSNCGTEINAWLAAVGCPPGVPYCAAFVSDVFRACGAQIPTVEKALGPASCDRWMQWAKRNGSWIAYGGIGYAVVYGKGEDAQHIGVIVRRDPRLLSVEANTSLDNSPQREGIGVDLKHVNEKWVLGYIRPQIA